MLNNFCLFSLFLLTTAEICILVGLVVGVSNSFEGIYFVYHSSSQRWWPHYKKKKKDTPWYFSAICFNFLLPSSSLFSSNKKKLTQLSNSNVFFLRSLFEWEKKRPNVIENFLENIAHSSSFLTITFWTVSWFIFDTAHQKNGKEHNFHTNCM